MPAYRFTMVDAGVAAGTISIRISNDPSLTRLAGHIGFRVDAPHRGRRLAARAVRLLIPLAKRCGLSPLYLTTTEENAASRRTMAILGAEFAETVSIPPEHSAYAAGQREKMLYRLRVDSTQND